MKVKDLNNDGVKDLCGTLVMQAVSDYKNLLEERKRQKESGHTPSCVLELEIKQLEDFLVNSIFMTAVSVDGRVLIENVRKRVQC